MHVDSLWINWLSQRTALSRRTFLGCEQFLKTEETKINQSLVLWKIMTPLLWRQAMFQRRPKHPGPVSFFNYCTVQIAFFVPFSSRFWNDKTLASTVNRQPYLLQQRKHAERPVRSVNSNILFESEGQRKYEQPAQTRLMVRLNTILRDLFQAIGHIVDGSVSNLSRWGRPTASGGEHHNAANLGPFFHWNMTRSFRKKHHVRDK